MLLVSSAAPIIVGLMVMHTWDPSRETTPLCMNIYGYWPIVADSISYNIQASSLCASRYLLVYCLFGCAPFVGLLWYTMKVTALKSIVLDGKTKLQSIELMERLRDFSLASMIFFLVDIMFLYQIDDSVNIFSLSPEYRIIFDLWGILFISIFYFGARMVAGRMRRS